MPRRAEVGLVYITALVQGLALVTFPAASSIFTSPGGYGLSASRYGMMFIPQVILAILASSFGPALARNWTLKRVLQAGMSADLLAMMLLTLSRPLAGSPGEVYGILLVATGSLGFGFGTVVMALNTYAEEFSPGREDRAVLSLNALLGAGTALAPLLVAIFTGLGAWWLLPLTVAASLAGLLVFSTSEPLEAAAGDAAAGSNRLPAGFWLYAAAVLLYGIVETLSGNWSGPYLTGERGVSTQGASFALTAFWATVTIGRIGFAALSSRTTVRWIFVGLPVLLIVAFQLVSHARDEVSGIVAFGLAGLACSAFFPLCISLSAQKFPGFAAVMSGELIAFYQAGYGVAAFGVGALRDFTGGSFGFIYFCGSLVAAALLIVALAAVVRVNSPRKFTKTSAARPSSLDPRTLE
jgi:FHS family glucose/mannose:H+ symporter-like MFS transporter